MIAPTRQPPRPYLVDTTLRDGEQTPGVAFDPATRLALATEIAAAGVGEIEAGTPAMGPEDVAAIRAVAVSAPPCRVIGWCRARLEDLDAAARAELTAAHVSLPVSPVQLHAIGKDFDWALATLASIAPAALERFGYVSIGAADASRTGEAALERFVRAARRAGVHRVRLADTVGVWTPSAVGQAVRRLRPIAGPMELGFHGHNDLGMATANAVSAIQAGADCADVTVLGLGERAGNARLAETAAALAIAAGTPVGVDLRRVAPLARRVALAAGRTIAPTAPVIGDRLFRHESGVHVHGVLRDPASYEPYDPELTRAGAREIVLGAHSGSTAVAWALRAEGVEPHPAALAPLVETIRRRARRGEALMGEQLVALHERLTAGDAP